MDQQKKTTLAINLKLKNKKMKPEQKRKLEIEWFAFNHKIKTKNCTHRKQYTKKVRRHELTPTQLQSRYRNSGHKKENYFFSNRSIYCGSLFNLIDS